MRKTFEKKDKKLFKETQKAWESTSESYRQRFETGSDPNVIVEFLRESDHAIKEPWVTKEIFSAMQGGHGEFLRPITSILSNKREHKMRMTAIQSLLTMLEVDRLIAAGKTQQKAFEYLVENMRQKEPEQGWTFDVVKNQYFRTRKKWQSNKLTEIHVEINDGWTCLSAFPAIIQQAGRKYAGRWEISMCPGKEDKVSWTLWDFDLTKLPCLVSRPPTP